MKKLFIYLLVFYYFMIMLNSFGQERSGNIQGVITDSTTGEVLEGANVWLKGQSFGAASNKEGKYSIRNVPADSYALIVRYIGYKQKEVSITVAGGRTLELDIALPGEVIEGKPVVVTEQAAGQRGAINQQLTSNTIKNVVAAEKIHQLPDGDAAAALSRLPGVSLMNGDQVVIRGVQAKMNEILINGIQLPSTDMNDRSTNLGFISSNMLSGIEVVKALTPDMDANAIGGVVNLKLREAPENFHLDVFTQGNYNSQDRTMDNYKFWISLSNRFFNNKLGVFLQGNADRSDVGDQQAAAAYSIAQARPYGQAPYQMTGFTFSSQENIITNNGGSLILDYLLPHGKIILQNTYAHNISDIANHQNIIQFDANSYNYALQRNKFGKDLWINSLQSEYNFDNIKAEFSLSHSYANKYTYIQYGSPAFITGFYNNENSHPFGIDSKGYPISYVSKMPILTPEDVYKMKMDPDNYLGARMWDWLQFSIEAFTQHLYNSSLDFTIPVSFSRGLSSMLKLGGKFLRTTRFNNVNMGYNMSSQPDFYTNIANIIPGKTLSVSNRPLLADFWDRDYKRGEYFLNNTYKFKYPINKNLMDNLITLSRKSWTHPYYKAASLRNDFNGAEIFSAGYLMGTFDIGPSLSLITGLRYEHYNMDYHANFVYVTEIGTGSAATPDTFNTVNRNDDNIFPNAQLRYKFNDWSDIRIAYTKGISRPDYQAILPAIYYLPGIEAEVGNTELKPAISTNYDVTLSFYNNQIGLFTVSGFYKKLDNIFYQTDIYYQNLSNYNISFPTPSDWAALGFFGSAAPSSSQLIMCFINNPNPAYVRGFELEWQTNFWYLPNPFNSLVLNINYTKSWSDMDYQQFRNIDSIYSSPDNPRHFLHKFITRDTVRNARLVYQADDILNIALGVDYKGFSGRISFNLQGNVITSVGSRPETDQFTGNIYKWDFIIQQKLPLEGLSIAFSGINIFHNPVYTYQKFRRTIGGPVLENLQSTSYSPSIFEVNLRYGF